MQRQMTVTQTKFMGKPAFIMSLVFMELCPNTMALGAVATGSAKAYEHAIPAGNVKYIGLIQSVTAISARIGTKTLAVAVFDAMLVMVTVIMQMIKLTNHMGMLFSSSVFSWETNKVERPDFWDASARAKPPPSRKMTPQHILVSISLHVIRDGEFVMFRDQGLNGQKS